MERKNLDFEIKSEADGTFVAYGSTFGNVDLVGDIVQKGAFTKSLAKTGAQGVKMFLQHNSNDIIGKYTKIYEDEKGLVIEGKFYLGDIQKANETHFLMKQGEITQFSIGYSIPKGGKSFDGKGNTKLDVIDLHEISPVTYACNPEAELVGVKNLSKCETLRDFEECLRDSSNFSKKEAQEFISSVKNLRDSDDEIKGNEPIVEEKQDDLSEVIFALKQNNKILKG